MFNDFFNDKSATLEAVEPGKLGSPDKTEKHPPRVEFSSNYRRILIYLVCIISALLLAWSWFTELDEIAQAPGQVIPVDEVQPIRAAFDSHVDSLFVKAGDTVKKGDLLLTLDAKSFHADLEKYKHELLIQDEELHRHEHALTVLNAYLKNPQTLPSDLSAVTAVVKSIGGLYECVQHLKRAELDMTSTDSSKHTTSMPQVAALQSQQQSAAEQKKFRELSIVARRQQYRTEEQTMIDKIANLEKQVELGKAGVTQRQASLVCTQKQLAAFEKVFKSGASSKTECLDAKMRVEDRQKELTMAEATQRALEGQLESSSHELNQLRARNATSLSQLEANISDLAASSSQINTQMRTTERTLSDARTSYNVALRTAQSTRDYEESIIGNLKKQAEQLKASIGSEEHSYLKGEVHSPVDGTVALVNVQGSGEVVQHGQDLLTIVPNREKLVVCLHVPNEQIAFLQKQSIVSLQFPAYPYQQYGTIPGVVTLIDSFPAQSEEFPAAYKVIVEPKRDWIMCRDKKIFLRKGLDVEAQLTLRKRRLLITILAPLLKLQYAHFKA